MVNQTDADIRFAPAKTKYPTTPTGNAARNDKVNKSISLATGILLNLNKKNKNTAVPITPPKRESPGKYGKRIKYRGLKKLADGCKITYNSRAENKETGTIIKLILKSVSADISRLRSTKSSWDTKYK